MPATIIFISIACCSITSFPMQAHEEQPITLFVVHIISNQLCWSGLIWLICTIILKSHWNLSNGALIMPIITTIVGILCNLCGGILLMLRD
jgi:hypothetical protein